MQYDVVSSNSRAVSLGIDPSENAHITYYANSQGVGHAYKVNGIWNQSIIDAAGSDNTFLAVGEDRRLHTAYAKNNGTSYALSSDFVITPTPTSTSTSTPTETPTVTSTPTSTSTFTSTPTETPTVTSTPTSTSTSTSTPTETPTVTSTPTSTSTSTSTLTPTSTPANDLSSPTNLTARSGLDTVLLTWEPSQTGGIEGYHVYRQTTGELNFTRLTSTPLTGLSYRDESAQDGMTYAYYVTAVAPAGTESDPSNIAQVTFGQLNLVIPDTYAAPGELVQVPVNIENADGLCIAAMDIGILYDDQVATAVAVHSTALTTGYTFVDTLRHPDEVHISSIGNCQGLYGPGSLFLVDFQVAAGVTVDSSLDFVRGLTGTVIYDNGNLLTPVPLTLVDGRLLLGSQYVRGDINGDTAVNAADAALALQIAAGVITPTSDQRLAGDVNGDGVINAADSSMILYYAAYQTWPPVGALAAMSLESTTTTIYVTPGRVTAVSGAEIEVPVSLNDAANLAGGTVVLRYGEDLTYLSTRLDDTLSAAHFQLRTHTPTPGEVRLSLAGRTNLSGSEQEIVWLRFRVKAAASEANTWVEVTGAWLNDLNGRDFTLSALQKNVYGGVGGVGLGHEIYLPVVIRP